MHHRPPRSGQLRTRPPAGRLAAAAETAAGRGWPVFPVRPRDKVPAIPRWETAATTDPDRIAAWWSQMPWNVGISTGPAGLVVVDLDPGRGAPAPPAWAGTRGGADVLERLAATAGQPVPTDTFTVATPSVINGTIGARLSVHGERFWSRSSSLDQGYQRVFFDEVKQQPGGADAALDRWSDRGRPPCASMSQSVRALR